MRFVRYLRDGITRYGMIEGLEIVELRGGLFESKISFNGVRQPLAGTQLLPPIVPVTFYSGTSGGNYFTHRRSHESALQPATPAEQHISYRANSALAGHEASVVIPPDSSGKVQFEGELVVVIGRTCRNIEPENAMAYVFGYTIGNDISERVWQKSDPTFWRSKNADTFKPMGPWIDTSADIDKMTTCVRLNGREVSRFRTGEMVFDVPTTISRISRYITLVPGDVIWMGTDDPTLDMYPGDIVEIEITGLGVLRNSIVAGV
ncbi:fumarylacetoacetate hydrolase family protein [Candidimonas nitroreducens]|uniref:2-keto-4-pentenoate hydratase n=1 Tax=Candidimonas nitroreducens TaxID=683354 RepID=A0A225MRB7_9BURK|nr:fumarylacetoacetate hydrolase family protein [Candidimonas nitroreducens]OWT63917.1 2-keto-4-pentenoate hydratase [Candidimonas nitroreducens]